VDNTDRIMDVIFSFILAVPLILSALLIIRSMLIHRFYKSVDLPFDSKRVNRYFFLSLTSLLIILALFLGCCILIKGIFPSYKFPLAIELTLVVFFALYFFGCGGFLYGIGQLGHSGGSPSSVLRELIRTTSKEVLSQNEESNSTSIVESSEEM
jgi:hypothetical protein